MTIKRDDLSSDEVVQLITEHVAALTEITPAGSMHAMAVDALRHPSVTLWSVWDSAELVGCGALKELDTSHGEIKSMRTRPGYQRRGVATQLLVHIIDEGRRRGYARLSLETGAREVFEPARSLYRKFGFVDCPPFGGYRDDPNSVFMTKVLDSEYNPAATY